MILPKMKRTGATLAAVASLALASVVLLCGAGPVLIEKFSPQGPMQSDLNAGGHSITNAATISATNVVVSGSLTAPSLGTLAGVSPSGPADAAHYLRGDATWASLSPAATNSAAYLQPANNLGDVSSAATARTNLGLGSAATNSAGAFAPATGSTNYVAGTTDAFGDVIIPDVGTAGALQLNANYSTQALALSIPLGPTVIGGAGGNLNQPNQANFIFDGDSLTAGIGVTAIFGIGTQPLGFAGTPGSYPDFFASSPLALNSNVFNLGTSGLTTAQGFSNYNKLILTTTGTATNGSRSITGLASTAGLTGTMVIAIQGNTGSSLPYGITATVSGTTATWSNAAVWSGATGPVTISFATSLGYGNSGSNKLSAHLLGHATTGLPTYYSIAYGTNDYYVGGITASGTATTGNATISSMTINTGLSVGSASLTGTSGYNVWGLDGAGNDVLLGTVASSTSTSITLSSGSLVTAAMTTFKVVPPLSTWTNASTGYQALVNAALDDGDTVVVQTLYPFLNNQGGAVSPAYNAQQYDENRVLFNAWLKSTYTGVSNVLIADVGAIKELQTWNLALRNSSVGHPCENAYALVGNFLVSQFARYLSASTVAAPYFPFTHYGLLNSWLPFNPSLGGQLTVTGFGLQPLAIFTGGNSSDGYIRIGNTSSNPNAQIAIRYTINGTDKWEIGTDAARNGTADFFIYDTSGGIILQSPPGTGNVNVPSGNVNLTAVGKTLSLKGGTNACSGTVTLSGGTGTFTSTAITTNSIFFTPTLITTGGTPGTSPPLVKVSTGTATLSGVSTDNSTYGLGFIQGNQ
ncbi:MAG: hypothetical protein WDO13_09510 [Verrucomicrobiota bacterium]